MGNTCSGYHPQIFAMRLTQDLREGLREAQEKRRENKQLRKSYWYGRLANAMTNLKRIDPDGWEAWFDSDAVPDYDTDKNRALLVEQRITTLLQGTQKPYMRAKSRLYRGTFIWTDPQGAFIFREDGQVAEFTGEREAEAYIDATLEMSGRLLGALA